MKKAFRKRYDFTPHNPEKYLIFLKEHFTKTKPHFLSVVAKQRVQTTDGEMYAVDVADDIENPTFETIAECVINGEHIFLWNDHCWGVAVDKDGKEVRSRNWFDGFIMTKAARNKLAGEKRTVLLFKIGIDPVE